MSTPATHKLVLVSPVNESEPVESTYAPRLTALEGKRVGLLDNSKHKADKLVHLDVFPPIRNEQLKLVTLEAETRLRLHQERLTKQDLHGVRDDDLCIFKNYCQADGIVSFTTG